MGGPAATDGGATPMPLKVCIAGVTGTVGHALLAAVLAADDLTLSGAVARRAAGRDAGEAVGLGATGVTVTADLGAALAAPTDVPSSASARCGSRKAPGEATASRSGPSRR